MTEDLTKTIYPPRRDGEPPDVIAGRIYGVMAEMPSNAHQAKTAMIAAAIQAERAGRQWIRASERLPNHRRDVWVLSQFGELGVGHCGVGMLVCASTVGTPVWWQEAADLPDDFRPQ